MSSLKHKPSASRTLDEILKRAERPISLLPTPAETKAAKARAVSKDNAGPAWFGLAAPPMTPALAQDLKALSMRNVLDPKRHYRRNDSVLAARNSDAPKHFAIGTIIESAAEFYSDRLPRRQRGQNVILDSLLKDEQRRKWFKHRFLDSQRKSQLSSNKAYKEKRAKVTKPWRR